MTPPDEPESEPEPEPESEPAFAEPWHAQAFALARALHAQGRFAWPDFSAALGAALRTSDDYWACWLAALERVVVEHGLTSDDDLADRREAWGRAARATPHGQPIVLDREHTG